MKHERKQERQYLIDLQKYRSIVALAACIVTLGFSVGAITGSVVRYVRQGWSLAVLFRYFTTLSNILTALASSFIIPYAVSGIARKHFAYPKWLSMMHYSGTVCTTITMCFSMTFILAVNPVLAIGGYNFFLHVICPTAVLVSYMMVESSQELTPKETVRCMIPFFAYSLVYMFMVIILEVWDDFYMFNSVLPFWLSLPLMWVLGCAIAFVIRKVSSKLSARRRSHMISLWRLELDSVEIKTEVFGLGRYNGLAGDPNDLNIPYDIIRQLASRYAIDFRDLAEVYVRGLLDGAEEREAREKEKNAHPARHSEKTENSDKETSR